MTGDAPPAAKPRPAIGRTALRAMLPALVCIATITAFNWHALTTGDTVQAASTNDDVWDVFRPHHLYQSRYAQSFGELPDWNERVGLGQVLIGQYGTHYVPRQLALKHIASAGGAADVLAWLHAIVAALAAMALARLYGVSRWSAVFVGVAYALSNLAVRWTPLFHAPVFFAFLPVALLGLELIWRDRKTPGVPLLAIGVGATLAGSHMQFGFLMLQVLGVLFFARAVLDRPSARQLRARAGFALTGLLAGLVIAAPAVVPFLSEQARSVRSGVDYLSIRSMSLADLASLFDPRQPHESIDLQINYDLYLGLLAPALLVVGFLSAIRRRIWAPLLIVMALGALIALKTPLFRLLFEVVPGWNVVSDVSRISFVLVLPLALLMGLGLDVALSWRPRLSLVIGLGAAVASAAYWQIRVGSLGGQDIAVWLILAAAVIGVTVIMVGDSHEQPRLALFATPLLFVALTLAGATHERRAMGWEAGPDAAPPRFARWLPLITQDKHADARWMSYCQPVYFPQGGYLYHPVAFLEAPNGLWLDNYESFIPSDYFDYWQALTGSTTYGRHSVGQWDQHQPQDPPPNRGLTDSAGVSQILGTTGCTPPASLGWKLEASEPSGFVVYRNRHAYPMAYLSERWTDVSSSEAAVGLLAAQQATFHQHTDYVEVPDSNSLGDGPATPATFTRRGSEHIAINVPAFQGPPRLLVFLDRFDPGWHAYVGDRRIHISRVNGVFRGVIIPQGTRVVEFTFDPWWKSMLPPIANGLAAIMLLILIGSVVRRGP
jgi:hypothetical protein